MSNVGVEVNGDSAVVKADVYSEVTGDFGDFEEGIYEGTGVAIADIATTDISVSGDTLTLTGSGVTLTAAGAEVLPLYAAGEALDDLTLTGSLGTVTETPTWNPQLSLSKQTGFNPDGSETVTVTGTGFDPNANLSTRVPVTPGQPSGIYVVLGRFADDWQPSAGAPGSARKVISQKWAMPLASRDQVGQQYPSQAAALVELTADGSFSATLSVAPEDSVEGNYGVYTYAGGGAAANPAQELFVPISFAAPGAGEGDLDVDVTVPEDTDPGEPGEPGEFVWRVDGGATAVSLGTASITGDHFSATGDLAPIVVTDTRTGGPAWSVSAQVSDFVSATDLFEGTYLGWTPGVTSAGAGAVAGAPVQSGFIAGSGLADSRTLGAVLDLRLPLTTPAGDYTGTLTITAVS